MKAPKVIEGKTRNFIFLYDLAVVHQEVDKGISFATSCLLGHFQCMLVGESVVQEFPANQIESSRIQSFSECSSNKNQMKKACARKLIPRNNYDTK